MQKVTKNKPATGALMLITFLFLLPSSFAQIPKDLVKGMGPHPVVFFDSVEISLDDMFNVDPMKIAYVLILKQKSGTELLGEKGRNGAVYITSVVVAKNSYWSFLASKSEQYKLLFPTPDADSIARYEINGNTLDVRAAPGKLYKISNENFKRIKIEEQPQGSISNTRYIISIKTRRAKRSR